MNWYVAPFERRRTELLIDRATEGLGEDDASELGALLAIEPDCDEFAFDLAAAATHLSALPPATDRLSAALRTRILADAGRFLDPVDDRDGMLR